MSFETQKDYFRLAPNFKTSLVKQVLPEHFAEDYPALVSFLEGYYEFLDSDDNFGGAINELLTIRDVQDATLKNLDFVFDEIALGISSGQFLFPREALLNFGNFFRVKGSLYSAEGFFRAFFNENVEIMYPKDRLMRIGDTSQQGHIGAEADNLLQDGKIYQIFSVLIRSPISLVTWETLYRNFVHPSGFHLAAETVLEGIGNVTITTAESIFDPFANTTKVYSAATIEFGTPFGSASLLIPDDDDADSASQRMNPYVKMSQYSAFTLDSIASMYSSIDEWGGYVLTMDEADSAGSAVRFDHTLKTFDQQQFQTYSYGSTSTV